MLRWCQLDTNMISFAVLDEFFASPLIKMQVTLSLQKVPFTAGITLLIFPCKDLTLHPCEDDLYILIYLFHSEKESHWGKEVFPLPSVSFL